MAPPEGGPTTCVVFGIICEAVPPADTAILGLFGKFGFFAKSAILPIFSLLL